MFLLIKGVIFLLISSRNKDSTKESPSDNTGQHRSVSDIDGIVNIAFGIGTQFTMAENMKGTHYCNIKSNYKKGIIGSNLQPLIHL